MFTTVPYDPPITPRRTTPSDAASYLRDNGWFVTTNIASVGDVWVLGDKFMTWEQALTYVMWKRLHLGAV